jgi:MFS family permease
MPLHGPFTGQKRPHFLPPELRMFGIGAFCIEAAIAFIFISAPVFLFQFSQTALPWQNWGVNSISAGLIGLSTFYIIQRIGCLLFLPVATNTIQKLGFGPSLIIGALWYLLKFSLFALFPLYPWLFIVTALISGYGMMTYWISSMTLLTAKVANRRAGQEVGSYEFVSRLAQIMAPLLGALLSARFGFLASALAAGFFFILAAIAFMHVPAIKTSGIWTLRSTLKWLRQRENITLNIAVSAFQWERFGTAIFWPVFLFLTFERLEAVGYILTSATLLSLMFVYISGWVFDNTSHRRSIRLFTGGVTGLLWLPRFVLLSHPLTLVLNDAVDRIVKGVYSTVFLTLVVLRARQEEIYVFMINREIVISLSTMLLLIAFSAALWFNAPWQFLFGSFATASLISLILSSPLRKKN